MKFGEKLKKLRKENNITQDELAEKIYVTRTAISKWETGTGYPSLDSLKMLSKIFGTSLDDLISDEDIENQKILNKKKAKSLYWGAISVWIVGIILAIVCWVTEIKYLLIPIVVCVVLYILLVSLANIKFSWKEKHKSIAYIIMYSLVVILILVLSVYVLLDLF